MSNSESYLGTTETRHQQVHDWVEQHFPDCLVTRISEAADTHYTWDEEKGEVTQESVDIRFTVRTRPRPPHGGYRITVYLGVGSDDELYEVEHRMAYGSTSDD